MLCRPGARRPRPLPLSAACLPLHWSEKVITENFWVLGKTGVGWGVLNDWCGRVLDEAVVKWVGICVSKVWEGAN